MNMTRFTVAALVLAFATRSFGADSPQADAAATPKLKVLYVTGGTYHKYDELTPIITHGIAQHANVAIDVVWGLEPLSDEKFGDGYDAIVYNFCFAKDNPMELVNNALRVTREGKPTVMVHCAMHTFQKSDDWTDCCGMRTRVHDKYAPFTIERAASEHPIVKHFPAEWNTEGDELYQTINLPETSTALLTAKNAQTGKQHTVAWAHEYGKARVFGTTLGHDLKTVDQDLYHELLAQGLLWTCDKLDADGNPKPGYEGHKDAKAE